MKHYEPIPNWGLTYLRCLHCGFATDWVYTVHWQMVLMDAHMCAEWELEDWL